MLFREDKDSVEKVTAEKRFLTLLKTHVINQKVCFLLRNQLKTWTENLPEGSSLRRHMILVMNMHLRFHLFCEMTQKVTALERDQTEPPSFTESNIVFEN